MTKAEVELLKELADGHTRGAYQACDGKYRATAHALEKRGYADWKGSNWGSQFWAITEAGLAALRKA